MESIAKQSHRVGLWSAVAGILVVALASVSLVLGGLAQAQTSSHFSYPENGKESVTTLSASDPEGVGTTVWDLLTEVTEADDIQDIDGNGDDDVGPADVIDNADFKITDAGVLSFGSPPNFEAPTDRQADADPDAGSTAAFAGDNIYRVTVRASDGTTGETRGYYKIVVTVTDVGEQGKISVTVDPDGAGTDEAAGQDLLQFQPGAVLTATLTDGDSVVSGNTAGTIATGIVWKWSGVGTTADTNAYTVVDTPVPGDVGKLLTVTATYTDRTGDGKTATFTMPNPVQVGRVDNNVPEFASPAVTRTVSEGAKGMEVGVAVTATDADGDILTYTKGDAGDNDLFSIDKETGQITTGAALNYEAAVGETGQCAIANACVITVTATDSMGGDDTATVTIAVTDVNEKPTLTTTVIETQKVGRIERSEGMTELDGDPSTTDVDDANYAGLDPENSVVELTTDGADGSLFKLSATEAGDGHTYTLAFKAKPDFEMPTDSNDDNIYEVTVVATDGEGFTAMKYVTVKVTNVEEAGKVTLPTAQPRVGTAITAVLTDSDMFSEATVEWQWHRLTEATDAPVLTGDDATSISKATSATYTPVDDDKGMYLRAMATYYDMTYADTSDDLTTAGITASDDLFKNIATSDPSLAVAASIANSTPKFGEGASTERFVRENTDEGMPIGGPVLATDADDDTLAYTLGGRYAAMFDIDGGTADAVDDTPAKVAGQLRTKAGLDYEKKKTYMVTVTAHDGTSNMADASARINVTIHVTNVDEAPMVSGKAMTMEYSENGKGSVITLSASDPERVGTTVWDFLEAVAGIQDIDDNGDDDVGLADIVDNEDFKITDGGVLSFKSPPNFEAPGDGAASADPDVGPTAAVASNNVYRVTVRASDGTTGETRGYYKIVVTVTDVEEEGKISVTVDPEGDGDPLDELLQFQPDAVLTATLTDGDSVADDNTAGTITTGIVWKWSGVGTMVTSNGSVTYTVSDSPVPGDVGKRLKVTATYSDGYTGGRSDGKTATFTMPNLVQGSRESADNNDPEFALPAVTRTVSEGAKGMAVGVAVTATDDDGDILTYTLTTDQDAAFFKIDKETGQITTGAGLDYEAAVGETGQCSIVNECVITVTATDSMGGDDTATVTITVTDVNEKPTLTTTVTETQKVGRIERSENMTELDGNPSSPGVDVANYIGEDPEGSVVELDTDGADGSLFKLSATEAGDGHTYTLAFKAKPDFEMPTDSNDDNIYEVTVVATDGEGFTAMKYVTVKVTNVEEAGKVTLPTAQPRVGTAITAVLTDSDIFSEATVEWQWHRLTTATDAPVLTGDDATSISKATSATYTPVDDDKDKYLRAMATYYDMTYAADAADQGIAGITASDDLFKNIATSDPSLAVAASVANSTPKFDEGASTERFVRENTDEDMPIGTPVLATDADEETLTYTLGGRDAAMFDIDSGDDDMVIPNKVAGQLRTKAALDYEKKKTYMVTVTAHDSTSNMADASASIDVTIHVTNEDEAPEIMEGGLAIFGPSSREDYAENGTDAVGTYTAAGPNAASAQWTLEGADLGDFMVEGSGASVMLKFRRSPNYEMAADADTDNTYMVTVKANDGTYMDEHAVTVMVTNVGELGTLSGPARVDNYMENGTSTVATYSTDGPVEATWTLEGDDAGDFSISGGMLTFSSPPNHEAAADADMDNTYMVTVKADAGGEMARIPVTVTVTNVDEAPDVTGDATAEYAENATSTVATYTAVDPEGAEIVWSLGGDDAALFSIDGGELAFMSAPDFESPADMGEDNVYQVTVEAGDGTNIDTQNVTVTVTDVDDDQPQTPLARYDADNSGRIDKGELADAVFDYNINETLSKADLADLVFNYEIGG